ncbi:hypothetical protein HHI36_016845 [Cryptolaemus montrouzieri]|uniref:Fanconi anemia group D2 protein n=1 Tax=Cryptolaemus montrouzieri TaxID=559131 RepID=A0ABD2NKY6_9CUCU
MVLSQSRVDPATECKNILRENCFIFSFNEDANSITQEQSLVVRDIEKYLSDSKNQKEKSDKIIKGLKSLCSKDKYFKKALLPSLLIKEGLNIVIEQDSLIRLLLKVNILQDEVVDMILDEVTKVVSTEEDNPAWVRLLLNPLRYLPSINKSEELTAKLLDILEICSQPMQLEILDILPEILPDNHYNQAAKQLVTLLNSKDNPTNAIIECLSAFNLDEDIKREIEDVILLRILPTHTNAFPVLMEFLIGSGKGSNSMLMFKIRNALDSAMSQVGTKVEKESSKVLIFTKLKLLVSTRKQFVQDCLDMINVIKVASDIKPIDIFLLFLLHSTARNKKRVVELIFRKKVKEGIFRYECLEELFDNYMPQQIFKDCFYSFIELGCNLIRTSEDPAVKLFSEHAFKLLFAHKFSEGIYRKEILDNLLLLAGGNDKKYIDQVLNILLVLAKQDVNKLKQYSIIMMKLLEKMDSFELDAINKVFEILCSLTCADENDESMMSMRDEIHMIIRKQLSSSKKNIKFRGIIGAVVMARYIVNTEEEEEEDDSEITETTSVDKLPKGKAQNAAKLIEMVNNRVAGCYQCKGLFFDELAKMMRASMNPDKYFLMWLTNIIQRDFLKSFIIETFQDIQVNDINYSPQFSLKVGNSLNVPIMINIGLMSAKPAEYENTSVILLAPHFRLLRLLIHKKYNGDLTAIDALLGCAIVVPEVQDIENLDQDQIKQVIDCKFHSINWFRELISAFMFQKKSRSDLIHRLCQLIQFEEQLLDYLSRAPDHLLPQSYFDSLSQNKQIFSDIKKKQPQTKKLKSKETIHDDTAASTSVLTSKEKKSVSNSVKLSQECSIQFREIDTEFFKLLKLKLNFDSNEFDGLNISNFMFILKDLVRKLNSVILCRKTAASPINMIRPADFINDSTRILSYINQNFVLLKERLAGIVKENDGREDLPEIFTEEVNKLKMCFTYILECYYIILSWPDLNQSKNIELLRKILSALRTNESAVNSVSFLAAELISDFGEYVEQCLLITQGVFLVKILRCLNNFSPNSKRKKKVDTVCKDLLSKRWYNEKGLLDSGKNYLSSMNYLVNAFLDSMTVAQIHDLVANVLVECDNLKSKEDYLFMLASIDFKNFYIFYQGLCSALYNAVKNEVQSLTNAGHLELWKNTTNTMSNLKSIARTMTNKLILSTFLKKSITILRIFISHGVPIFEIMFSSHSKEIVEILKTMQTSTRFLHHLCCDSKMKKSISLVPHIPHFRLMLEQLIYKVKALLVANKCQGAFFIGNLKNKDIEGNTQLSDMNEDGSQDSGEDENEIMPDDDTDVEEHTRDDEGENKSDSDVFD